QPLDKALPGALVAAGQVEREERRLRVAAVAVAEIAGGRVVRDLGAVLVREAGVRGRAVGRAIQVSRAPVVGIPAYGRIRRRERNPRGEGLRLRPGVRLRGASP